MRLGRGMGLAAALGGSAGLAAMLSACGGPVTVASRLPAGQAAIAAAKTNPVAVSPMPGFGAVVTRNFEGLSAGADR